MFGSQVFPLGSLGGVVNIMQANNLTEISADIATILVDKEQTICVAESSSGGLISASLLAVPGASAFFLGGGVVYTREARKAFLPSEGKSLSGLRSASEPYAAWLAETMCLRLKATWGLSETGAAGPSGNSYGDNPGHSCFAVCGPVKRVLTIENDSSEREANMWAFAEAGLVLLRDTLSRSGKTTSDNQ